MINIIVMCKVLQKPTIVDIDLFKYYDVCDVLTWNINNVHKIT